MYQTVRQALLAMITTHYPITVPAPLPHYPLPPPCTQVPHRHHPVPCTTLNTGTATPAGSERFTRLHSESRGYPYRPLVALNDGFTGFPVLTEGQFRRFYTAGYTPFLKWSGETTEYTLFVMVLVVH